MEKAFEIQKQIRDNAKAVQSYMTDLKNWEAEMKRKEAALNGQFEQDLPPVRSKIKKDRPVQVPKKPEKRISASDYKSWEKFDVDKACEDVIMEDIGPISLDSKKSEQEKQEKLREEAQYEKERGNMFVKQEMWDEAISCYNRAIELVKDDAIYYANRGLCYLKKDSLHHVETDCTEALRLDPTYVKALQRRATARERLGSLRAASRDLNEVLKLEPHNNAARKQLEVIKARIGTKGPKCKSSPVTTPSLESKPITSKPEPQPKITEIPEPKIETKLPSAMDKWRDGIGENITVIKPVKKPPHLRSKRPLKAVPIREIQLGMTSPEKPATRLKIVDIEDDAAHGDTNNVDSNKIDEVSVKKAGGEGDVASPESIKLITDCNDKEKNVKNLVTPTDNKNDCQNFVAPENNKEKDVQNMVTLSGNKEKNAQNMVTPTVNIEKDVKNMVTLTDDKEKDVQNLTTPIDGKLKHKHVQNLVTPMNSVQFMSEWKNLKDNAGARSDYLSIIDPQKIPSIFANALESDVLSEVLCVLHNDMEKFKDKTVSAYLKGLSKVKRFSALAMFLSTTDKEMLTDMLKHCEMVEKCSNTEIADLKNKYEL